MMASTIPVLEERRRVEPPKDKSVCIGMTFLFLINNQVEMCFTGKMFFHHMGLEVWQVYAMGQGISNVWLLQDLLAMTSVMPQSSVSSSSNASSSI